MEFNEIQSKFWNRMLKLIKDFRKREISYTDLVYGLEACLDMGEYKNAVSAEQWYNYWTPLEILSATKGNNTTLEEANKYISDMETFLKSFYGSSLNMEFNEIQSKFWNEMLKLIEDFRKREISYTDLVNGLEMYLDVGEYENEVLIEQWYDYWTPLKILSATKGNNTTLEEADKDISNMETFLKSFL